MRQVIKNADGTITEVVGGGGGGNSFADSLFQNYNGWKIATYQIVTKDDGGRAVEILDWEIA